MVNLDILHIVLVAVFSFGVAIFQYFYKAKRTGNKLFLFAFLRFLSVFLLGFLLLNPSFKRKILTNVKPNLIVAIDNSESIRFLNKEKKVKEFLNELEKSNLSKKFNVDIYSFGTSLNKFNDSISFSENQTNISEPITSLKKLYNNTISPTLLLTDGNQTLGNDYVLSSLTYNQPIYPIVLGDSIPKEDIRISNIQHNKYTFIGNEYPVEVTINYIGDKNITENVSIYSGKTKLYSKVIKLSKESSTVVVNFLMKATQIGKFKYTIKIPKIINEENKINNKRDFSIEVIDERTNVLIVSDIVHPDVGTIKKSIESNKQRKVTISTTTNLIDYNKFQLIVLYQPTENFKNIFKKIDIFNKNHLIITGLQTNWSFLNSVSKNYSNSIINKSQDYLASYNPNFNLFESDKLDYSSFPPLIGQYGEIEFNESAFVLLHQKINSLSTEKPLFCFFENNQKREGVLFGEGLWKWRSKSYMNAQDFKYFDALLGKTVQYLSSNSKRERLVVFSDTEYLLGAAELKAQYFNKNYVIDSNEIIFCKLKNNSTNEIIETEFLYKKNEYSLDLKHLNSGVYNYTIKTNTDNLTVDGEFEIVDFNIESQFINPNVTKLSHLATNSKTNLYFVSNYSKLIEDLKNNDKYKITQKESAKIIPLINWEYLLWLLIIVLSIEWFLRKYKGLI